VKTYCDLVGKANGHKGWIRSAPLGQELTPVSERLLEIFAPCRSRNEKGKYDFPSLYRCHQQADGSVSFKVDYARK